MFRLSQTLHPATLALLERVVWNPTERGPLLVVAPEHVLRVPSVLAITKLPTFIGNKGVNVGELGRATERHLVHTQQLSALVPEQMWIFSPQMASEMDSEDALLSLVASLSTKQWQQLGGSEGLAAHDLTPSQFTLFHTLAPSLTQGHAGRPDTRPVPEKAILQGQLRLAHQVSFGPVFQAEHLNIGVPIGFRTEVTNNDPRPALYRDFSASSSLFQKRNAPQPNRLKPSQLDYKMPALNKPLALEGVSTVEILLRQASQVTGLELKADRRIAVLPIWSKQVVGQRVPVGELLELLALSVTGAFRKLDVPGQGCAWILTDDIEGLATRLARQRQSKEKAKIEVQEQRLRDFERLKVINPEHFVGYDNPYGLDKSLLERLEQLRQKEGHGKALVSLDTLPRSLAKQLSGSIQNHLDEYQKDANRTLIQGAANPPLDMNRVNVQSQWLQFSLEVPGYGIWRDEGNQAILVNYLQSARLTRDPASQKSLPPRPTLATKIVVLAPQNEEEIQKAVEAALTARLSALWIVTDGAKLEPLKAAIAAGKKVGLPMVALLVLSQLPETAPADVDIFGQPSPYRVPDSPQSRAVLLPRLRAVATLPGLAGIAFAETAPLGYVSLSTRALSQRSEPVNEYGYTPARRLAFLRTEGYDPIDLTERAESGALTKKKQMIDYVVGPAPSADPLIRWSEVRFAANKKLLSEVYATLKKTNPTLPLWIEGRQQEPNSLWNSWYGSWEKATPLPTYRQFPEPDTDSIVNVDDIGQARRYSKQVLYANSYPDPLPQVRGLRAKESLEAWWTELLSGEFREDKTFPWDGAVLDLRTLPIAEALKVFKATRL
ncbi:hypothetical protein [Armatimonas sp.]|uniref:hypothetical protein n=1 Tax=Armatimonas sp. TaxID=1872638 RepID=UPI00286B7093|nr:hypothetical protein [Armatimonas sp.]